jgi:ABC-type Zn2+ transport system substrate-binding protein/surface adhesin
MDLNSVERIGEYRRLQQVKHDQDHHHHQHHHHHRHHHYQHHHTVIVILLLVPFLTTIIITLWLTSMILSSTGSAPGGTLAAPPWKLAVSRPRQRASPAGPLPESARWGAGVE